ncbi:MAG: ATP-dependent DNA helicase RecQ [Haliscomenobacteraceae bacterium CHB4]|nr:ATP-dependent DNA helicase RecQ [Haliscomenobacteraceae bacterium CHB4]
MPMPNNIAGYFNTSLRRNLEKYFGKEKTESLLRSLALFQVETNLSQKRTSSPLSELAVLHNLLIRGLPTLPSLFLEEKVQQSLGFTSRQEKNGSIEFLLSPHGEALIDDVLTALHIVDKRLALLREGFPQIDKFDSEFEKAVFFDKTAELPYLRQLLEPQVQFDKILRGANSLYNQRVDFAFATPYFEKADEKKQGLRGFILEVDGQQYHSSLAQILLDQRRDVNTSRHAWETHRTGNLAQAEIAFQTISKHEFVSRTARHFAKPLEGKWLNILQLALTPFAIARLQKVLVDAMLVGHLSLNAEKWEIVVVERDVPCAHLGVADLQETMRQLFKLSGHSQCPEFILKKICVSSEFQNAALHNGTPVTVGEYDGTPCDLLIDISVLRRYGLEHTPSYPGHYAIIRSARWPEYDRKIISAPSIIYRDVWQEVKAEEENKPPTWRPNPETLPALEFFLQNLFRKVGFREGQLPILQRALQGKTVIGLLPTGGGKSLTYQLAALLQPGLTLVIDPIRSLMKDQVDGLRRLGIDACQLINSSLSKLEKVLALHDLEQGRVLFSLVSPERLLLDEFREPLKRMAKSGVGFSYCVVDEAHCVSEWGHDFRTAYLALGKNAVRHCRRHGDCGDKPDKTLPLFGLTATASFDVLSDVERELDMQDAEAVVRAEYNVREEIQYRVQEVEVAFPKHEIPITRNGQQFQSKPIVTNEWSIKEAIAEAKLAALNKILEEVPAIYQRQNEEAVVQGILQHTWDNIFDGETQNKSAGKERYLKEGIERICYPGYLPQKMFGENGGLIFAPHREWVFGVTEKFKPQKGPNGEIIRDATGKPVSLAPEQRRGIADKLAPAGFLEAIPENLNDLEGDNDLSKYVGTFMGASEEGEALTKRIDADSFRNQDLFLQNRLKLMVATKAFGMGIDKSNIRFTVHFNIPSSPEGFVQECGRAGRDRRLALAFVLYSPNLYGLSQEWIKKYGLPTSLENRWFDKADFEALLAFLNITEQPEKVIKTWHPDRDIPEFFHRNSFKGVEKEIAMVRELLEEVTYETYLQKRDWEEQISEETGLQVTLGYQEEIVQRNGTTYDNKTLYIEEAELGKMGLISLPQWQSINNIGPAAPVHEAVLSLIKEKFETLPSHEIFRPAFEKRIEPEPQPGIIARLKGMAQGEQIEVEVGFSNRFENTQVHTKTVFDFIHRYVMAGVSEGRVSQMLEKIPDDFGRFCRAVLFENQTSVWAEKLNALSQDQLDEFRTLYYTRRLKADTDKAVYRLTCAGIVEDFRVDYRLKMYYLTIRKQRPEEYVVTLYDYVRRYHADQRAQEEVLTHFKAELKEATQPFTSDNLMLPLEKAKNVLRESLDFLIDFAYREVAAKRLRAISDMVEVCEEYVRRERTQVGKGNFAAKEWLFLYFNSKYARPEYEAKLSDEAMKPAFSLLDETERSRKELAFSRLLKYLEVMNLDKSGSENDNIKHLRGAATRLLRDNTNNASLKLLKAFSLFVLAYDNATLFQEAEQACLEGFAHFLTAEDAAEVETKVNAYKKRTLRYVPQSGKRKVRYFFDELLENLLLEYHLEWLKQFNAQFLNEFNHEHYHDLTGTKN